MNVQLFAGTDHTAIAATTVRYWAVGNTPIITSNSSEANAQIKMASAGTYSLMGCYVSANDRGDGTLRFRLNGGNGNQAITLTDTVTGQFEDGSNSDAVVDDSLVNLQLTPGGGGTTMSVDGVWNTFAPSSGTITIVSADAASSLSGTADLFFPIGFCSNTLAPSATEANFQNTVATSCTIQTAQIRVSSNSRSETCNFKTRKNGADGNILLQFTAAATGILEDTSNTDSLVDGDEICWTWDQNSGTGSMTLRANKVEISATNCYPIFGSNAAANSQANNLTHYIAVGGDTKAAETTEADAQLKSNVAFTWSDMYAYVSDYSLSGGSPSLTIRSRINGGDGNMVVTGITATGQISDTSNTQSVVDNDEINYAQITAGNAGSSRVRTYTSLATDAAPAGKASKNSRAFPLGTEIGMNFFGQA